jgi:4-aminobutyrate aminotransferase-like enzyme
MDSGRPMATSSYFAASIAPRFHRSVLVAGLCIGELRDAISRRATGRPPAFIMEPVQGNGAQLDFPERYYHEVRQVCTEHDILLIFDEVQTGFGHLRRVPGQPGGGPRRARRPPARRPASGLRGHGQYASRARHEMKPRHRLIGDIRGPGLLIGVELMRDQQTKEPATAETLEAYRRAMDLGVTH